MVLSKERFIVLPDVLTGDAGMVILTDFHFWGEREDELRHWCKDNDSQLAGMTVTFPDKKTLSIFVLRWS